ncbi:MAG: AAA family ATPase [Desulfococcaceae bacterium]|nr:AAA family ATPase [Desulfococcaceae bacterium]
MMKSLPLSGVFLGAGLKDSPHLFKGVITGILRIAKESVFSDLNNLRVYSILDRQFGSSFGFTEEEVKALLDYCGIPEHYDCISRWYNGYLFGGTVIYNPWSVLNYADTRPEVPEPYWVNTGGTGMIDRLATGGGRELREEIGLLLEGKSILKPVHDSIVIKDLEQRGELLWTFLLYSVYLRCDGKAQRRNIYPLTVPATALSWNSKK